MKRMQMRFRIPIATKLIALTVSIVVGATILIATQTSAYLEDEMGKREDISILMEARSRAKEVEQTLNTALERVQIMGALLLKNQDEQFTLAFNKDKHLVSFEIWKVSPTGLQFVARKTKEEFFQRQNLDPQWIGQVRQKVPFPTRSLIQKNLEIRNSTLDEKAPLLTLGFPLARDENDQVTHIALADIQMGLLQKSFSEESPRSYYLLDRTGQTLAHKNEKHAVQRTSFADHPIVAKSFQETNSNLQYAFQDPETGKNFFGAYAKIAKWDITSFTQIDKDIVLEPAYEVRRKSFFIAGIVISIALFLCFLFSMTLTSPIEKLARLIKLVSKGNFDVKARLQVKSNDEVGDLAIAFDDMTEGLKERDKAKSILNKFHGSSVAEDMLKNDIAVGGTRKDVTVFFSDIRGFTKFSEGHTPEEVVAMLNEYFQVMVGIINSKGGVVDKFIGDAIMAVWGAPQGTEKDTSNAVAACLEMRKALADLNERRASRGQTAIMIGMGLHCGPAISGTIGSDERMEYTVIGDTVNMTSRIESSTKAFGSDLLVSDDVFRKVGEEFGFEFSGSAEVKGKSEPLKLYKVRGLKDPATGEIQEIRTPFSDFQPEDADKVKIAS